MIELEGVLDRPTHPDRWERFIVQEGNLRHEYFGRERFAAVCEEMFGDGATVRVANVTSLGSECDEYLLVTVRSANSEQQRAPVIDVYCQEKYLLLLGDGQVESDAVDEFRRSHPLCVVTHFEPCGFVTVPGTDTKKLCFALSVWRKEE